MQSIDRTGNVSQAGESVKGETAMLFLFFGAVFVFTLAVALVGGVSEP
jgi:hypothetical protein